MPVRPRSTVMAPAASARSSAAPSSPISSLDMAFTLPSSSEIRATPFSIATLAFATSRAWQAGGCHGMLRLRMANAHALDPGAEEFEFAGWGRAERITDLAREGGSAPHSARPHATLGVWRATAICGNDISSSVLYVSALCAAQAGALAPIALLAVAGVLYLFRKVYGEVGSALPLNGGTYTLLLNTTGKRFAAAAACLTLLSYVATAVISANEAMHYAANLVPSLPVIPGDARAARRLRAP